MERGRGPPLLIFPYPSFGGAVLIAVSLICSVMRLLKPPFKRSRTKNIVPYGVGFVFWEIR